MFGYKNDKLIEKLRLGLCLFYLKCIWSCYIKVKFLLFYGSRLYKVGSN